MARNATEAELNAAIIEAKQQEKEGLNALNDLRIPNQRVPKLCCECNNEEIEGECVYCGN